MAENLLEQLEQRIQKNEKVTASEVADAYTQTVENRRKEYMAKGGSYEKFDAEEKTFLDGAKELRNKQLERIGVLGKEFEAKRMKEIYETREKERGVKFEAALKYGRDITDPDKSGAVIDDYEGIGRNDTYGFGRQSLSGYLAAMQSMNPNVAKRDWDKAVKDFEASNYAGTGFGAWLEETFTMDKHLSDENVKKLIGHENLNRLQGYDLGDESKAFLAGYLRYSDEYYKDGNVAKAYKDYVINKLQELKEGGKLAYEDPKKKDGRRSEDWVNETNKSKQQIQAFVAVLNPKEWDESWKERLQKVFDPFKKTCDTILAANAEFKFEDAGVKEMLNKNLNDLSYLDDEKLRAAVEKARQEISSYMGKKKEEYAREVDANKKRADDLKARNKALRGPGVTEEEWKSLDATLAQQATDLEAASAATQKSSFEDLSGVWNKLVFVRDGNGLIKAQLDGFEQKTKEAEEKEPLVLKLLEEKNLVETYDAGSKQYKYELGESSLNVEGRKVVSGSKNPEVKKAFESKTIPYIHALLDKKALTDQEKKQYDAIIAKADPKDKEKWKAAIMEASAYLLSCVEKKLTSDDLLKFQRIQKLYDQAAKDSTLTFDHRPSLEELKKAYDEKFTPAWEKAGKDFDAEFKPLTGPLGGPGGAPSGVVGGGFLGGGSLEAPPEKPSGPDPYVEHWGNGEAVPLPEGLRGYNGGLMVAPSIESINLRDTKTHKPVLKLEGGTGMNSDDLTFVDSNAKAWRVDDRTFVPVNYKGTMYYAAAEFLQKNGRQKEKPAEPVSPVPAEQKDILVQHVNKVNGEYRGALERMLQFGETPEGVSFDIWYNKQLVNCHFNKMGPENYVLKVLGNTYNYRSLRDSMLALNGGYVVQNLAFRDICTPANYERYEKKIDSFKKDIAVSPQGEVHFELDWKGSGRGEGNAMVWVSATPYGGLNYHVRRDHAGFQGESDRYGFAANFDDFMKQLGRIKTWSEEYEDRLEDKKLSYGDINKEILIAQISDPRGFYGAEQYIGRPVSFDIGDNGVVQMYLDWGGGAARDIMKNAMLNVWVNKNGNISYILNPKSKGVVKQGEVKDMDELTRVVAESRSAALAQ